MSRHCRSRAVRHDPKSSFAINGVDHDRPPLPSASTVDQTADQPTDRRDPVPWWVARSTADAQAAPWPIRISATRTVRPGRQREPEHTLTVAPHVFRLSTCAGIDGQHPAWRRPRSSVGANNNTGGSRRVRLVTRRPALLAIFCAAAATLDVIALTLRIVTERTRGRRRPPRPTSTG